MELVAELHGATIVQEERAVLENVSFGLEKSEFAYLIGRTGAGKSSLLKTLYADLPLVVGAGSVAGFDLERLPPGKVPYLRRRLGIVFQDFQLLGDRPVGENLLFVLNATGWRGKARKQQRVQQVLTQVGLSGVGARMPYRLSGGEQQRVVIARALLNEPTLLLADEPTGNLDPEVAAGIMDLFSEINHAGTAIIMATHNFQLLEKYPHRVLTCQDGALLDSGRRGVGMSAMRAGLSILIPVFNRDVAALVGSLQAQAGDWPGAVEIILLDDKSAENCQRMNRPLAALPGVRYEELPANVGRAAIRNQLAAKAEHDWLLLLDNDSLLPDDQFLARYAQAAFISPAAALFIGGTAYLPTPPADPSLRLRWLYGRAREMRPAAERQRDPGGQLSINNALVRKELLVKFPLDERLSGYGHEDTRFGLELARAGVVVRHLDNPVLHDGLEPAASFLEKSHQAVRNLAQVLRTDGLGADTRLARTAGRLRRAGLAGAARAALAALEPALRRNLLSARPSLRALDALKLRWLLAEG